MCDPRYFQHLGGNWYLHLANGVIIECPVGEDAALLAKLSREQSGVLSPGVQERLQKAIELKTIEMKDPSVQVRWGESEDSQRKIHRAHPELY